MNDVQETKSKKSSKILFTYTGKEYSVKSKECPAGLNKSAAVWLDVLKAGGKAMGRDECVDALALIPDRGTSQEPIRVMYYWKKFLAAGGWIVVTKKEQLELHLPVQPQAAPVDTTIQGLTAQVG